MRGRLLAGIVAGLAVIAAAVGGGLGLVSGGGAEGAAPAPATTTLPAPAPPTTAPPPPPTTVPPELPVPEPVPADPYENVPVVAIGEIEIPRLGVLASLYDGVSLTVVDHGPGHWPGTALPGGWGNVVIAGHRTTNTRPFRDIDQLAVGDEIQLRTDRTYTYRVTGSQVVDEDALWIVDQHPGRTVTLFACHPPGSARYRYVVTGELVEP